jgi:OPA family sugar phosphate sensor protein UhpC-like MFS transporter
LLVSLHSPARAQPPRGEFRVNTSTAERREITAPRHTVGSLLHPVLSYFRTGPDRPLLRDQAEIRRIYERRRWSVLISLILGYGFFYTCRLGLSVAKQPMLDAGAVSVAQLGAIGSALLYVYAVGKFVNGVLSDRANVRRFMSVALLCSALVNIAFGSTTLFYAFVLLWALNGWFQSIGSAPSVVSICQWFSNKERGTRYGIWAGAHNIGEGLTFVGTAWLVSQFGWRGGFVGPGILCVFVALVLYQTLADRPQTYGLPHVADYRNDYSAGPPQTGDVWQLQKIVLRNPLVWLMGCSSALMYVARYAINSWAVLFLQEGKDYTLVGAGAVMGAYPIAGFVGASASGWISDHFFGSRRHIPTLVYGCLQTGALVLLWLTPPGYRWLDVVAMAMFGFGVGGLIVFLAGLTAIDLTPKAAAGAVKGLIGLFSYMGAATQDWISGLLIGGTVTAAGAAAVYDFDRAFVFWIGASALSALLPLLLWNKKPQE